MRVAVIVTTALGIDDDTSNGNGGEGMAMVLERLG